MEKNLTLGMLRNYISRIDRVSICMKETLNYKNYSYMRDVPSELDELYVYGIGMIDSEFYEIKELVADLEEKPENRVIRKCIEIMLSKVPKDLSNIKL